MVLFLCEKPSQARDIGQILGVTARRNGYLEGSNKQVTWCLGHLLEMSMPDSYKPEWKTWRMETLPIIPDQWQLQVRQKVGTQFKIIKGLLKGAHEVVIATDADREGETIGREVLKKCSYHGPISRLWLSALDDASIRKALQSILPGHKTEPLYQAGLGRARADWLIGMNLSRAYTILGRKNGYDGVLTVGRVQTPTLKLVVDRDRLIENFKPIIYFSISVLFQVTNGHFQAKWLPAPAMADKEGRCLDPKVAAEVANKIQGQTGQICKAETKRVQEPAPLPLELSTLQQEASRLWGMSAQKSLDVAQSLYETHKAITYPRTDSRYLPVSQFHECATVLKALAQLSPTLATLVEDANPSIRSRAWNDSKVTAHHAIIPTSARVNMGQMSMGEKQIHDLICRHYLAQFFPHFEFDQSVIEVSVVGELFRATGRVEVLPGWKRVLPGKTPKKPETSEQTLPPVKKGEPARVDKVNSEEKRTKPPNRFTEGTLVQAMKTVGKDVENPRLRAILRETAGIGTEATRASIIGNLQKRRLLAIDGKKYLLSMPAGRMLVDMLPHSVTDPATTAVWEQVLDDIANGQETLDMFLNKSITWITRLVSNAKAKQSYPVSQFAELHTDSSSRQQPVQKTSKPYHKTSKPYHKTNKDKSASPQCQCGQPMRRRKSSNGEFWGCSSYPKCRFTRSI